MRLKTLEEKKVYFNQVKLANFRESARLEGINVPTTAVKSETLNKQEIKQARQKILNRYLSKS